MWLVALVLSVVMRCGVQAGGEAPWWSSAVYYRVLVDSFKDGDGDGLGDLSGAVKQISYVRALGADAVILSSLCTKSKDCTQPGITDFAEIDSRYGNHETLNGLLDKTKKLELKVVVTLPLKTMSVGSEWFTSSADKVSGFEDTFVWQDGTADESPAPQEGIEAWRWHEGRSAYFGAANNEAMLNLCSEAVAAGLSSAQCTWLRRGVSGILLNPDFAKDQRCAVKLLQKMVAEAMVCARSSGLDTPVILVESSLGALDAAYYYSDGGVGANSVFSAALTSPSRQSAAVAALAFHGALLSAPQDAAPTWMTSAPFENRIATRYGSEMVDAINLLTLILPGAAVIQQGDELGVADTILEWATNATCWPSPATPSSAPFPWSDAANGGFTNGEPWLPLAPNYRYANAKAEFVNDNSHVGVVKVAAAMRRSPAIGPHVEIKRLGSAVAVLRWGGHGTLMVASNLGQDQTEIKLASIYGLPSEMTIAASSTGSSMSTGSHLAVDKTVKLGPGETLLLAGGPRHCGGPGPVDKIANKLSEGWQKINKYFSNM